VRYQIVRADSSPEVQGLHLLIFPDDEFESNEAEWIAYDESGTPVAFCSARTADDGTAVYLSRAGVLPCAAGNSLQRRMIQVRTNWARKQGARYCTTYTLAKNYPSMINLLKSGFKFYHPAVYWGGEDSHYYIKDLGVTNDQSDTDT